MILIDSHCHIHDENFPFKRAEVFANMRENGVSKAICIGENLANSKRAVVFVEELSKQASEAGEGENSHEEQFEGENGAPELFAAVGVHPHEAENFEIESGILALEELAKSEKVVAIGEIGLDYFYENSPKEAQKAVLRAQLKLAQKLNLPVSFHIRNAFDDFWPIFDEIECEGEKIRGVVHSFTDNLENLEKALARGLFIGVNGISTFVKKPEELEMFAKIPLEKILLETDAPFLAPTGKRGEKNQPAWVRIVAENLAEKRGISLKEVAEITSKNTQNLFEI